MILVIKKALGGVESGSKRQRKDSFWLLRQLVLVVAFCLCSAGSRAATFAWDPSPDAATPGMVAGYKLYYSTQLFTALPADVATNSAFTIVTVGDQTSVTITNLLPGQTYYFAVTAFNSDGEESDLSNILPFTEGLIGNQPPIVGLTSPANNTSFLAGEVVTISATASDPDGTVALVEFLDGVTSLGTDSTSPYSINISNLPPGLHTITAMATDDKGVVTVSAVATITISVNQAPTVALTSPAANASFFTNEVVTITASAGDSDGTITKVEFFDGATMIGSDNAAPYTMEIATLAAGSHTLTARATDNTGAVATSQPLSVTIKVNQAPTITLILPLNNSAFLTNQTVTISATASDADGTIAKMDFFDGTTLIGTKTVAPFSMTTSTLSAGTHVLSAKATDDRGASVSSTAATVTISVNQAPTVTLTSPAANSSFYTNEVVTLSATASDSDGTIAKVEFFDGGTLLGTKTAAPFTIALTTLSAGSHIITAKATDDRGSAATSSSATVTIKVNQAPSVFLTSPANNSTFLLGTAVSLGAFATDADGSIAKVEFLDGSTVIGTKESTPFSLTFNGLAAGQHSISARATDNGGAVAVSPAVAITIKDNKPPAVVLTEPAEGSLRKGPTTVTATASDTDGTISSVEFFAGTQSLGIDTELPFSISATLPSGFYDFTARATDNDGAVTTSAPVSAGVKPGSPGNLKITAAQ